MSLAFSLLNLLFVIQNSWTFFPVSSPKFCWRSVLWIIMRRKWLAWPSSNSRIESSLVSFENFEMWSNHEVHIFICIQTLGWHAKADPRGASSFILRLGKITKGSIGVPSAETQITKVERTPRSADVKEPTRHWPFIATPWMHEPV